MAPKMCRDGKNGEVCILPTLSQRSAALVTAYPERSETDVAVLVPCFEGLTPALADIVGLLPIRAANAALLEGLAPTSPAMPLIAGILSVDPFLNGASLYRRLAARGITGVVNLPSVAVADGALQQALAMAGLDVAQELRVLAEARHHGLEPVAMVFSQAEAARAVELGISRLIVHPGLPSGDAMRDRASSEAALATVDVLRRDGLDTLLYRHPDLAPWLPASRAGKGHLAWRIGPPTYPSP